MSLGLIFLSVSFVSFSWIAFIVLRKIPNLMLLSEESLVFKETFSEFIDRKVRELPSATKNLQVSFLETTNKQFTKYKTTSVKASNMMHDWTGSFGGRFGERFHRESIKEADPIFMVSDKSDKSDEIIASMAMSQDQDEESEK